MVGDTVKATLTPIGDKAAGYLATTVTRTVSDYKDGYALSISAAIPAATTITVKAPAGSTISGGTFRNYWNYEFAQPAETANEADGVTVRFTLAVVPRDSYLNYNYHFIRVQHPDGVTYWTFGKWNTEQTITVTSEDLHIGDAKNTKDSVYRFDKNMYDRADIYLNVNRQGYINMETGATRELDAFRNWQAIENHVNSQIALPDMHYQVIDFDGNPSDVVSVTPDANNSSLATLTPTRPVRPSFS